MRTVLDYVIERTVHLGRDTAVHRARRMPGDERVALKLAAPDLPPDRRALVDERLRREASVLSTVTHPSLVRLIEMIEIPVERGRLRLHGSEPEPRTEAGLVLPWAPLGSLADAIGAASIEGADLVDLARQLAGALAALHAAGFVHGDLSPANVLQVDGRTWWLADLGESRHTAATAPDHRRRGTDGFVAPEVRSGHPVDPAADVFALGSVVAAAAGIDTADVETRGVGAPADHAASHPIDQLVRRATCPDPARRPTASELERELSAIPARRDQHQGDPTAGTRPPPTGGGGGTRPGEGRAPRFVDRRVSPERGSGLVTRDFDLPAAIDPPAPATSTSGGPWHRHRSALVLFSAAAASVVVLAVVLLTVVAAWNRAHPGPAAASARAGAADDDGVDDVVDAEPEPEPAPCPGSSGDAPPGAVAVPGDLDGAGCTVAVLWWPDRAEAQRPDPSGAQLRFALGRPGDQLVMGDWDGDGRDTPALYTPATGTLTRFDGWARPDDPLPGTVVTDQAPPHGIARVRRLPGADQVDIDPAPP